MQDLSPEAKAFAEEQDAKLEATPEDEIPVTGNLDLTDIQIDTLAGDVRDAMLMRFRDARKSWEQMNEAEQIEMANGFELAAKDIVRKITRLVTAWEFPRCPVHLGEIKIVGGDKARIEGKIVAENYSEYRDILGEHVNTQVLLVAVDSVTFMGERGPVEIDPDQPEMDLGADGDGDDSPEAA